MKAFIITVLFLFHFLLPIKSSDIVVENNMTLGSEFGMLYANLGTASKQISSNESISVTVSVYKQGINSVTQKSFKNYHGENLYRYNIVCISESKYNNELTSTWLFGFWVKVNDVLITRPIYPRGKDVMVSTIPTLVHYIETEEEEINIKVGWIESVYDPKIIK